MRTLRTACAAVAALVLAGCAGGPVRTAPDPPAGGREQDALIRYAQKVLVDRCLAERGLTTEGKPSSPEESGRLQAALFGAGPTELSLTLPTGHTVRAHTDGCLAAARHALYGDQRRWFRAEVTVNNLGAEAAARMRADPAHRAARARFIRCLDSAGESPTRPRDEAAHQRCRRGSGLASTEARLEPVELAEVRSLRHDQLTAHERLRTSALHRAAEISAAHHQGNTPEKGSSSP
ncbi:hypothetical protein [Streptomyces sp. WMMC940]|uniref:hypothetical protein n=1 Tax=Streptomyces sp. WMMC940 TaxID=3015153 RepID=UPI0022B72794|nr:hypothetical protein [Streptomyces sp. WMMC940]MCZ7457817.1 hypothetical protein [Streptomyces sp. WMMC940]